ncbi:2-(3-amino-3-carboxypropyl)histidine synthase subunit 2 [Ciona intestinalis]
MASAFYTTDKPELLASYPQIKQTLKAGSSENIKEKYDVNQCVQFIKDNGVTNVALQFPDEMLNDAVAVTEYLQLQTDANIYLLADTSYGNYDVDEVAAQHVQADLIIHFGKASLTSTSKTKTLFVLGKMNLSIEEVVASFKQVFPTSESHVFIFAESTYVHALDEIYKQLLPSYPNLSLGLLKPNETENDRTACSNPCTECSCTRDTEEQQTISGHSPNLTTSVTLKSNENSNTYSTSKYCFPLNENKSPTEYSLFFIGSNESEDLKMFLFQLPTITGYVFDPDTKTCNSTVSNIKRQLAKKYYLVEKLKDAKTIGIVVGTLGMAGYLEIIEHLKHIISLTKRKSYTFVVGKINPAKLANFSEIDVFVVVACPEQTNLDSSEYFKPLVTPYEVEVAYNANREWGEPYVFNFRDLLPGGSSYVEFSPSTEETISLITGEIRNNLNENINGDNQLEVRSNENALSVFHPNSSVYRYIGSTWKGLEQKLGETEVTLAEDGRSGLPVHYSSECT